MQIYPRLILNSQKLINNTVETVTRCREHGIDVCGIIKGCNGKPLSAEIMAEYGVKQLGSSRMSQLAALKHSGIKLPLMLIRTPAPSEAFDTVKYCDISLNSEKETLILLNEACKKQKKTHSVIIMADLGDLREGIWDEKEFLDTCVFVEKELSFIKLLGIGTNLGCYGSVVPTPDKMNELISLAQKTEKLISRKLEIVSGGATSSFLLVHSGEMPSGINHLRIGENMLVATDLKKFHGVKDLDYLLPDVFTLRAEICEIKDKPSYPQGELGVDAFGIKREYKDIGIRKRALLNVGRADTGELESLVPLEEGIFVVGGSSDQLILDITDAKRDIRVGDTVDFSLLYSHILYLSSRGDVYFEIK